MSTFIAVVFGVGLFCAGLADRWSIANDRDRLEAATTPNDRGYWRVSLWRARYVAPLLMAVGVAWTVAAVVAALT